MDKVNFIYEDEWFPSKKGLYEELQNSIYPWILNFIPDKTVCGNEL